jgi:hypothetical protein
VYVFFLWCYVGVLDFTWRALLLLRRMEICDVFPFIFRPAAIVPYYARPPLHRFFIYISPRLIAGKVIFSHEVGQGDIWRMCQTKDAPIKVSAHFCVCKELYHLFVALSTDRILKVKRSFPLVCLHCNVC